MKLSRLVVDLAPLRASPAFRRLWLGTGLSAIGSQMTVFAVVLQIYQLTGDSLAVGSVGLSVAVPSIAFGLVGGTFADAVDRRRLVLITSGGQTMVSLGLALQAFADVRTPAVLYALVAIQSLLGAISVPARRTLVPRLVSKPQMPAAIALTLFNMHISQIVGPGLAGVIAAAWGVKACYVIDAISFATALYAIARLPAMRPEGATRRLGWRAVGEALQFVRRERVLGAALLADLCITVLGMPTALLPALNTSQFGGRPETLGALTAATAIGGVLGTALSGPLGRAVHPGRTTLIAGAVWGIAIAALAVAPVVWLAIGLLVIAGACDVTSVTGCQTIVQIRTPDSLRGRVIAVEHMVSMGGPQIGNFRAGAITAWTSPALAALTGGLASLAGMIAIAIAIPAFARYRVVNAPAAGPHSPSA